MNDGTRVRNMKNSIVPSFEAESLDKAASKEVAMTTASGSPVEEEEEDVVKDDMGIMPFGFRQMPLFIGLTSLSSLRCTHTFRLWWRGYIEMVLILTITILLLPV